MTANSSALMLFFVLSTNGSSKNGVVSQLDKSCCSAGDKGLTQTHARAEQRLI